VIELGEITYPAQQAWLAVRLHWLGAVLAHFISALIGKGNVPSPEPYTAKATTKLP
jgi:hypothetical protein